MYAFKSSPIARRFVQLSNARLLSGTPASQEVKTFALEYTYVPNMAEKRVPVRPAHLKFTESYIADKTMIAGGAFVPEMEAGLLLFRGTREMVEKYAKNDPYVVEGLVAKYKIREWAIAVGKV